MTNMERWRAEQAQESRDKAFRDAGLERDRLRGLVLQIRDMADMQLEYKPESTAMDGGEITLCRIRGLIDEHQVDERHYVCPECGQGFGTDDQAWTCGLTCYRHEGD